MICFIPESFCDLLRKLSMDAEITRNWNLRLKIRNENVPSFLKSKGLSAVGKNQLGHLKEV